MPHAHLAVSHLLKQLELHRSQRTGRDRRPGWLSAVIDAAAELFDPVGGVGRVGFDCRPTEGGWTAALYLGAEETVGGPDDGRNRHADFRFDLLGLSRLFDAVESLTFDALPAAADEAAIADDLAPEPVSGAGVTVTVRGTVAGQPLTLAVHAVPPATAGPGFRRFPNGRREMSE